MAQKKKLNGKFAIEKSGGKKKVLLFMWKFIGSSKVYAGPKPDHTSCSPYSL